MLENRSVFEARLYRFLPDAENQLPTGLRGKLPYLKLRPILHGIVGCESLVDASNRVSTA